MLQLFQIGDDDGTAYLAHFGGAAMGALLVLIIRPRGVEQFDCEEPEAEAAEKDAAA